jgi:hypothetical protein
VIVMDNIESLTNNVLDTYCRPKKQRQKKVQNLMTDSICIRHVDKFRKMDKKDRSPHTCHITDITAGATIPAAKKYKGSVVTSTRQSMSYVTVKGIESETSYLKRDWPLFILKELSDNAYDFLNDYYPNTNNARVIAIVVKIDTSSDNESITMLRMKILNSNIYNIPVFEHLGEILDFSQWCNTKRDQHRETCGSLGDGLKRCLGMGYAAWTNGLNKDSFTDKQWDEPLIVRHNGQEYRAFIRVDNSNQIIQSELRGPYKLTLVRPGNDTEIEVTLPISTSDRYNILTSLEKYYRIYGLAKSNTDFSFNVEEGKYHNDIR